MKSNNAIKEAYTWICEKTSYYVSRPHKYTKVSWQVRGTRKAAYATYYFVDTRTGAVFSAFQEFETEEDSKYDS